VACGAPQNASEHVAASFVAGRDAVADQESHRAAVIGNDTDGNVVFSILAVSLARYFFHKANDRREKIRVVIAFLALNDGGQTFQSHTGVDAGFGQRR